MHTNMYSVLLLFSYNKHEECQQTALLWESVGSKVTRLQAVWSGVQSSVWARYFSLLQSTHAPFSVGANSPEERHPGCEADH